MKIRIVFILIIILACPEMKSQIIKRLSFSGSIGVPIGKKEYTSRYFPDPALFSNHSKDYGFAVDLTLHSSEKTGFGLFLESNRYLDWSTNVSDRFDDAFVRTTSAGPFFFYNIHADPFKGRYRRIIVSPFLSYLKVSNPERNYFIKTQGFNQQNSTLTFERSDTLFSLQQILPGIRIAYEWTFSIHESGQFFIRPGLNLMLTTDHFYPDKYVFTPNLAIGYTFDYSRNKWFFIKENK